MSAPPPTDHAAPTVPPPDSQGIRTMPAYDKQIAIEDRWTIVAYLRALERSQNARPGDPGAQ